VYARSRGIIIADTKFEFGRGRDGQIILIDEVLTPDSSRFWPLDSYEVGKSQASFDKQYVRDYLEGINWDKRPPAPRLPLEVATATTARYLEAYEVMVGEKL
jgi:phosphoribosylaminoimidazole-succinocarboxamide synthase